MKFEVLPDDPAPVPARGPVSKNVIPDDLTDTVLVYGVRVTGELMRGFTEPTPPGRWFRITNVDGELATIEQRTDLIEKGKA